MQAIQKPAVDWLNRVREDADIEVLDDTAANLPIDEGMKPTWSSLSSGTSRPVIRCSRATQTL
jgi:hypothetical protein